MIKTIFVFDEISSSNKLEEAQWAKGDLESIGLQIETKGV